ncbi:MAG: SurA N-terminal domain-containing protein [Mesorhizobium sp.]
MLDSLRKAAGTWVAKLLLGLLVLSFAVWGISGSMLSGVGGNTVLTTGGTTVSTTEYRLAYDRQVQLYSQQIGQRLTREQAVAIGLDNQVLAQLAAGAVLDEQASRLGLGVSRDKIAVLTREDSAFFGPSGQFDRMQFEYVLRQVGMRAEDYFRNREQVAVRQQIVEAVSDGMKAPETFLRAAALYQGENRSIDYITLSRSIVPTVAAPDDATLKTWFDQNKATYAAPEFRKVAYVKMEPADISDPTAITDDDVAKDYEAHKARYTTPEIRTIEQLVFPNEAEAQTAVDSIRGGTSFDALVTAQGKTPADVLLGSLDKGKIADAAIAEAAFSLPLNQPSEVVKGNFGPVILRITDIKPEVVRPLSEVSEEIRNDLALSQASAQLLDVHDKYEDARAAGSTLEEAAASLKLNVVVVDAIDRAATDPQGNVISNLPASAELLSGAFETQANVENPAINIGSSGFVYYEVKEITEARERTLDEVKEKASADWIAQETDTQFSTRAAELEKRLRDTGDIDAIATELGLTKETKRGLRRGAEDANLGASGVAAVFAVTEGSAGLAATPDGQSRNLFKVTEVFEPEGAGPDSIPEQTLASFNTGMANDLLDQLVERLKGEYGVSTNPAAIQQALSF